MTEYSIPVAFGTLLTDTGAGGVPAAPLSSVSDLPNKTIGTASVSARTVTGTNDAVTLPAPESYNNAALDDDSSRALSQQGYTTGLALALLRNKRAFPVSIWIVDNSGSMNHQDGHRLIALPKRKREVKFVECTRWAEMQQTVDYHAQMSALLRSPTVFRMLNDPGCAAGPQQFSVAERGGEYIDQDLAVAQSTMLNTSPGGVTPLVSHLRAIRANLLQLEPQLRQTGQKVVLVIATDGLPTDDRGYSNDAVKREFVETLRGLEGLPVWVVVRLCTDEDAVVEYWNGLDGQLELSLEVLDDFVSEAEEVHEHNKWLNYALPLHRMREMGFHDRLFDLLDERKLSRGELRDFFRILFGDDVVLKIPDPEADWKGFVHAIQQQLNKEEKQWNPITKKMEPWVDMRKLKKDYGGGFFFF